MSCDSGRVLTFSINLLHYFFVVFDIVESYAPGFKDSVIGRDILTPPDLEKVLL
jgi:phytoene dehydrogenase-like protein